MRLTAAIYRSLVMARHPEAMGLWRKGIDYDQYRSLRKPWLRSKNIGSILDIGANEGQFARLAHAVWPSARIYSFEPLPDCHQQLCCALPAGADFHPMNVALGNETTELDIERSAHSPSSSFLAMTQLHRDAYPESAVAEGSRIRVKVRRLDDVAAEIALRGNLLIKIDVQGFESNVIAGGRSTFERACVVMIETSFASLYEGQPLFHEIYTLMRSLAFEFRGNLEQMLHAVDGRVVQADSIFERVSDTGHREST
jgi:FkbM family methyltransferase